MVTFSAANQNEPYPRRETSLGPDFEIVAAGKLLHLQVAGDFSISSYSAFAAAVDRQVQQHGRVCVLVEICDCVGRRAVALWQDETLDFKLQSVDHAKLDEAKTWLEDRISSRANVYSAKRRSAITQDLRADSNLGSEFSASESVDMTIQNQSGSK